jgi:CBS domain-containing protein
VTRQEWSLAAVPKQWPSPHSFPACEREQTIRKAQNLLIESEFGILLLVDEGERKLLGMLTLHDLLRAQESTSQGTDI